MADYYRARQTTNYPIDIYKYGHTWKYVAYDFKNGHLLLAKDKYQGEKYVARNTEFDEDATKIMTLRNAITNYADYFVYSGELKNRNRVVNNNPNGAKRKAKEDKRYSMCISMSTTTKAKLHEISAREKITIRQVLEMLLQLYEDVNN